MADLEVSFRGDTEPQTTSYKARDLSPTQNSSSDVEESIRPPNTCRILQRKLELKVERAKRNYSHYQEENVSYLDCSNKIDDGMNVLFNIPLRNVNRNHRHWFQSVVCPYPGMWNKSLWLTTNQKGKNNPYNWLSYNTCKNLNILVMNVKRSRSSLPMCTRVAWRNKRNLQTPSVYRKWPSIQT